MDNILIIQFEQFWRMFAAIVSDFDEQSWNDCGYGITKPSKLSFHIIQSIKYYMDDKSDIILSDGKILPHDHKMTEHDSFISRQEIIRMIDNIRGPVKSWIMSLDLTRENERCKWTGSNLESVVLFMTRHSFFHLGELNALLNEYRKGEAPDHFADNIY